MREMILCGIVWMDDVFFFRAFFQSINILLLGVVEVDSCNETNGFRTLISSSVKNN